MPRTSARGELKDYPWLCEADRPAFERLKQLDVKPLERWVTAEIRTLEDRLGFTPESRLRLGLEVTQ